MLLNNLNNLPNALAIATFANTDTKGNTIIPDPMWEVICQKV